MRISKFTCSVIFVVFASVQSASKNCGPNTNSFWQSVPATGHGWMTAVFALPVLARRLVGTYHTAPADCVLLNCNMLCNCWTVIPARLMPGSLLLNVSPPGKPSEMLLLRASTYCQMCLALAPSSDHLSRLLAASRLFDDRLQPDAHHERSWAASTGHWLGPTPRAAH